MTRPFSLSTVLGALLAAGLAIGAAAVLAILSIAPMGCDQAVASARDKTTSPGTTSPGTISPGTTSLVEFTSDGRLKRPVGYRMWMYIGTPVTPNDMNNGAAAFPEFHSVYMDPDSFAHYERTGEFRDGTILVKELTSVGSKRATSGNGYFMGEFTGLEVSIKDRARFKDEPGYWAYFSFGHEYPLKDRVAKNQAVSCNQCHQASAAQDYVFTQYYPVIRGATNRR